MLPRYEAKQAILNELRQWDYVYDCDRPGIADKILDAIGYQPEYKGPTFSVAEWYEWRKNYRGVY